MPEENRIKYSIIRWYHAKQEQIHKKFKWLSAVTRRLCTHKIKPCEGNIPKEGLLTGWALIQTPAV